VLVGALEPMAPVDNMQMALKRSRNRRAGQAHVAQEPTLV